MVPRELSLAEIFQIGYYWETKILLTAVKLDLFSALGDSCHSAFDLANRLTLDQRALPLLLNALVAMRVLNKEGLLFSNTSVSRKHLIKTSPEYVGHLLVLHDGEWNNWGKLEDAIRTGISPVKDHVFETDPEMGANVLKVLNRIGRESGPSLAMRIRLNGAKRLLDLGGGAGTNAIAFCQTYPDLHATVFDLSQSLEIAKETVRAAGLEQRVNFLAGNFLKDPLEGPYDMVLMSDILHYQDGKSNAALIHKVIHHLVPGGSLVIKDRFLDQSGTSPAWTTAFAVHIMVNTERGQCFTGEEVMQWMQQAGFESVHELESRAIVQGTRPNEKGRIHG